MLLELGPEIRHFHSNDHCTNFTEISYGKIRHRYEQYEIMKSSYEAPLRCMDTYGLAPYRGQQKAATQMSYSTPLRR